MSKINVSWPTKAQIVKAVEFAVVGFGVTFITALSQQPDPLSKHSLLLAWGAGVGFLYGLAKGFVLQG